MKEIKLYSDGSSRGNPGPGGYGTILSFVDASGTEHRKEYSAGYRLTTNNRMELLGVIRGLSELKEPCAVTLITDSQYVANAISLGWLNGWIAKGWKGSDKKPVKNIDLWQEYKRVASAHHITVEWVRGHNGHPENERCDELATTAADGEAATLLEDAGYTNPPAEALF